jgi:WD40 repeat protein/predicted Ser/Thr protein kinase
VGPAETARPLEAEGEKARLGDFVLLERLGAGGAGVVHRAWQLSLRRFVALKIVHEGEPVDAQRFLREAHMAARLSHPNIVPIYEVGEEKGRHYLAMKLVEGRAMSQLVVSPARAAELMVQAVDAIDHAHRAGIVHRDIKPQNLLLEGDRHVWVTDFGVARSTRGGSTLTMAGSVLGTPAYMPPEQARGERGDERSDVYALGATLYELVTGQAPFQETDLLVVMTKVLSEDPQPPRHLRADLPVPLETIIGKAMAKDPARRYRSAHALGEDLRRFLAGDPIQARPPGLLRQTARAIRRHPFIAAAFAFVLAFGLGAVWHTLRLRRQLIETMVAEANALGAAGQWEAARARYAEAAHAFKQIGVESVEPELGLLDAHHHAPPPLLTLTGHTGGVRAVVFSADGRQALSASNDGSLRLWDVRLGRAIRVLRGHTGEVLSVAVAGDGRIAMSGGQDGTARIWDLESGQALRVLAAGAPVRKVALSPDGKRALSRTMPGKVQLWEVATGRPLRSIDVAQRRVIAVAFSPDGRLAFTGRKLESAGAAVNTRASLWEVETGRELQTFGGFGAEVESAAFSPDGHRVLTAGYDRVVSVWDVDSGRRLLTLKGHLHGLKGAAFSPGNRLIVSGGQDDSVKLWDADGGQLLRSLDTGDTVEALAVSPDGRFILTGGEDRTLKLWDVTVGHELRTFPGHESTVTAIEFSPDGLLAVSAGSDRKTRLWDVATGREIRAWKEEVPLHAVAISPDGHLLATAGYERVAIWRMPGWDQVGRLVGISGTMRTVAFSPDGKLILGGSETGDVKLWDRERGQIRHGWRHAADVRSVTFTPDGRAAVTASFDGTVVFHDVDTGAVIRTLRAERPEQIGALAISRDGRWLATGNDTKVARLWDLETGRPVRPFVGHLGDVRAVAFSPDGALLLTASRDRSLRVWEVATGRQLHEFDWASDASRSFVLSPDGRLALVGNDDGSMNFLDFSYLRQERAIAARLPSARAALQRSPDDASALATLGEWYAFRGVSGWALEVLGRAQAGGASISPLVLGRSHWQEGDFGKAKVEFERARAASVAPAHYLDIIMQDLRPSDLAVRLTELSQRDARVRLPFLGLRADDTARGDPSRGARVTHVYPRTPAYEAGLRVGDVIVRANDQTIENDGELGRFVASQSPGAPVVLTFARAGQPRIVQVTLAERPVRLWEPDPAALREGRSGYDLQALTPELAVGFGLDPQAQGVLVVNRDARPSSDITRHLRAEDIIVKIEGRPVVSAQAALAAMAALPLERWDEIEVIRPGRTR